MLHQPLPLNKIAKLRFHNSNVSIRSPHTNTLPNVSCLVLLIILHLKKNKNVYFATLWCSHVCQLVQNVLGGTHIYTHKHIRTHRHGDTLSTFPYKINDAWYKMQQLAFSPFSITWVLLCKNKISWQSFLHINSITMCSYNKSLHNHTSVLFISSSGPTAHTSTWSISKYFVADNIL